ncbi:MAG TPA: response regulator [Anaeromyxobacteraceae bacterium]|nr:response regulator [Anaeromyxobacteraceae bacterium]
MSRPRILLVDDNAEFVNLLARFLESEGWAPVTASRGRQALDILALEKPAAAAVDILLPDMMGYDVAQALRRADVPFVFMTGVFKGARAAAEARVKHGALGYFEKPFEAKRLAEMLRSLKPAEKGAPEPPPPGPPDDEADFDVEVAVETEDTVPGMELTGKIAFREGGVVQGVLHGKPVEAAPVKPAAPRVRMPAAQGRLGEQFPELITAFYEAQQTGELTVQKGKVKKTIYFEKGRPCFAISNLLNDRFGHFLVRVGKITPAQFDSLGNEAKSSGKRLGDLLVERGLLKDAERLYYLAQQLKAIIYSIFAWEDGEYRLHFTDRAAGESVKLDLHPANLIARGVKKLYKPERLRRLIAPEDYLVPSSQPSYDLYDVEIEKWEAEILPLVDGNRPVAELVARSGRPAHVVHAFLYAMVALRILEKRPG